MTNDERNPRPECRKTLSGALAGFLLRILLFLRISSFVIRICDEWFMESPLGRAAVHRDHEPAGQTLGAPASRRRGRRRSQARFMERSRELNSTFPTKRRARPSPTLPPVATPYAAPHRRVRVQSGGQ